MAAHVKMQRMNLIARLDINPPGAEVSSPNIYQPILINVNPNTTAGISHAGYGIFCRGTEPGSVPCLASSNSSKPRSLLLLLHREPVDQPGNTAQDQDGVGGAEFVIFTYQRP